MAAYGLHQLSAAQKARSNESIALERQKNTSYRPLQVTSFSTVTKKPRALCLKFPTIP